MNIQNLVLDINKKCNQIVTANVGEVGSRFLKINIVDNGIPVDLTGVTVYLYAKKPDNTKVFNTVKVEDAKQGIVLAEITSQALAIEGLIKLTLLLVKNNARLATKIFNLRVDETIIDDEAIESSNEFGALTQALSKVNSIDNKFNELTKESIKQATEVEIQKHINEGTLGSLAIADHSLGIDKLDPSYIHNYCDMLLSWDDSMVINGGLSASFRIERTLIKGDIIDITFLGKTSVTDMPLQIGIYATDRYDVIGVGANSSIMKTTNTFKIYNFSLTANSPHTSKKYVYFHLMFNNSYKESVDMLLANLNININGVAIDNEIIEFTNHFSIGYEAPVVTCNINSNSINNKTLATVSSIESTGKGLFLSKNQKISIDNFDEPFIFETIRDINLFNKDDNDIVLDKYYYNGWKEGNVGTVGGISYSTSGFIPVELGETYTKIDDTVYSYWNENKQFVAQSGTNESATITVPYDENIKYIRITIPTQKIDTAMFVKGTEYPGEYIPFYQVRLVLTPSNCKISDELLNIPNDNENVWKGKKWYACGTSMTSTSWGRYTPYLRTLSGLNEVNLGVPNGTIANTQYPSIQNALLNIDDDADLITLEAGVNDWTYNVPLGELGDTEPTTYYGALYTAFELFTNKPKARIVTITMHHGTGISDPWRKNSHGVTQKDYNEALIRMSELYSIPCIRVAEESGIGQNRYGLYLRDNIHHTDLGGKVFAEFVWSKLKYITPLKIS